VKALLRQPHQSRSGYVALVAFLLTYSAAMAVVIAPEQVKLTLDASWAWLFG
jgi:hypothetical protein